MTTILLAVDVAPGRPLGHVSGAIEMAARLAHGDTDRVIVLHVRNFSLPRLARTIRERGGAPGRSAVDETVADLRSRRIRASGLVREADNCYVAQTILATAAEFGADLIVLGAREPTDLPRMPFDMATHLLHRSTVPVLIAPPAVANPVVEAAATTAASR